METQLKPNISKKNIEYPYHRIYIWYQAVKININKHTQPWQNMQTSM